MMTLCGIRLIGFLSGTGSSTGTLIPNPTEVVEMGCLVLEGFLKREETMPVVAPEETVKSLLLYVACVCSGLVQTWVGKECWEVGFFICR